MAQLDIFQLGNLAEKIMDDFKILYEKAIGHRNAMAIRNAALEFDLALAQDRIAELEKQIVEARDTLNFVHASCETGPR